MAQRSENWPHHLQRFSAAGSDPPSVRSMRSPKVKVKGLCSPNKSLWPGWTHKSTFLFFYVSIVDFVVGGTEVSKPVLRSCLDPSSTSSSPITAVPRRRRLESLMSTY
ncbi:hypothetical protein PoB_007579300 [Plakobranchus ocellatus]|uniref:Uncharacterized protein n=1 Tax=Plakobranchus ocellatus TaxID=259542 RepID=A0AAV4DY53_9GAST|nr:hypothetical protein PoB_007579300 [Plakobranchus ocellatus]